MRASALSVPAKIVEGGSRESLAHYSRLLNISLGSWKEISYSIHFAERMRLLSREGATHILAIEGELAGGLTRLIQSLKNLPD